MQRRSFIEMAGLAASSFILTSCPSRVGDGITAFSKPSVLLEGTKSQGFRGAVYYGYNYYPLSLFEFYAEKRNAMVAEDIAPAYGLAVPDYKQGSGKSEPVIGYVYNSTPVKYSDYFDILKVLNRHTLSSDDARLKKMQDDLDLRPINNSTVIMLDLKQSHSQRVYLPLEVIKLLQDSSTAKIAEQTKNLSESYPGAGLVPNSQGKVFIVIENTSTNEFSLVKTTVEALKTRKAFDQSLFTNMLVEKQLAK